VAADLPSTAVTPGAYTSANITVDQQGRITAAANGSGGGATIPSVTNIIKGNGSGNGADTKVAITSPATAATIAFSADNETVTLPNGTVAAYDLNNITTILHDLTFTDATYDIGKSGATRPRDGFFSRNFAIGGTLGVTGHVTLEGVTSTGATGTNLLVFGTSPTIVTPTIASFANATHNHTNAAGGGQLNITTASNATGTPSSSTYLRGDNTWSSVSASGCAAAGSAGVVQASNGSSGCQATTITDNGTTVVTTEPLTAAGFTSSDTAHSGFLYNKGLTSGGVTLAAADVAGTNITYVLPSTNGTAGQILVDTGSTACPTLPSGPAATCHLLGWVSPAANKVIGGATPAAITVTSSYVNTSIATTGGDIDTSSPSKVTNINGTSFAGTSGHLVSFGAANIPADSGVVAANVFTGTATNHGVAIGGAGQALSFTGAGTATQCLTSNGASSDPTFQTCGVGAGVSAFSGDGTLISNSASTGAVTATLATAAAHKFWMNNTGSTAAPGYQTAALADLPGTVVNATSPGAGIAHFAGSTQTVTSSAIVNADIANTTIDLTAKVTGVLPQANMAQVSPTAGTSVSLTSGIAQMFVCTAACTVTPPAPAAGAQYCVWNDDNVATVITLAAIGSSARYENTARTAYGTAGTGTFVSGGAVGDAVCLIYRDSTHYQTLSHSGTWTAN
jgi:hypothetical protein